MGSRISTISCFSADVDKTKYPQLINKPNLGCLSDCGVHHFADIILPDKLRIKSGLEIRDETLFVFLKSGAIPPYNIYAQLYAPISPEFFV